MGSVMTPMETLVSMATLAMAAPTSAPAKSSMLVNEVSSPAAVELVARTALLVVYAHGVAASQSTLHNLHRPVRAQ